MRQQLKRLENCVQRDDGRPTMKSQLIAIVAAVLVVGCATTQQLAPAPETKPAEPVAEASQPEQPTAKALDISIHDASKKGNLEAVKQHLAAGSDVNAKYEGEWTPLHSAASFGHKEVAELLIAKGADVNATDNSGWTPLHFGGLSRSQGNR